MSSDLKRKEHCECLVVSALKEKTGLRMLRELSEQGAEQNGCLFKLAETKDPDSSVILEMYLRNCFINSFYY